MDGWYWASSEIREMSPNLLVREGLMQPPTSANEDFFRLAAIAESGDEPSNATN